MVLAKTSLIPGLVSLRVGEGGSLSKELQFECSLFRSTFTLFIIALVSIDTLVGE